MTANRKQAQVKALVKAKRKAAIRRDRIQIAQLNAGTIYKLRNQPKGPYTYCTIDLRDCIQIAFSTENF